MKPLLDVSDAPVQVGAGGDELVVVVVDFVGELDMVVLDEHGWIVSDLEVAESVGTYFLDA